MNSADRASIDATFASRRACRSSPVYDAEIAADHVLREGGTDDPTAEHEHVHVVMLDSLMRRVEVLAIRGSYSRHLVRRDARTDARTAEHDAAINPTGDDLDRHLLGEIGIVDALGRMRPDVDDLMAKRFDEGSEMLLQIEARMVGSNGDLHDVAPVMRSMVRRAAATMFSGSNPNSR